MVSYPAVTQFIDQLLLTTFVFFTAVVVAMYIAITKEFYVEAAFFAVCTVIIGVLFIGQAKEVMTGY